MTNFSRYAHNRPETFEVCGIVPAIEYRTPVGTFSTYEEASDACERVDFDPCECVEIVRVFEGAGEQSGELRISKEFGLMAVAFEPAPTPLAITLEGFAEAISEGAAYADED